MKGEIEELHNTQNNVANSGLKHSGRNAMSASCVTTAKSCNQFIHLVLSPQCNTAQTKEHYNQQDKEPLH